MEIITQGRTLQFVIMARYLWSDPFKEDEVSGTQNNHGRDEEFRHLF
jgi:hypothetical protein